MTRAPLPVVDLLSCAAALLALMGTAGLAQSSHPGLQDLVPLVEVYGAANANTPEFDVAGIRCAGLFAAQETWAQTHGGAGMPSRTRIRDINLNLDRAQITRQGQGLDLSRAHGSVQEDIYRVTALYAARFRSRSSGDGLPWQGDGVITSDTAYCDILNGRR